MASGAVEICTCAGTLGRASKGGPVFRGSNEEGALVLSNGEKFRLEKQERQDLPRRYIGGALISVWMLEHK